MYPDLKGHQAAKRPLSSQERRLWRPLQTPAFCGLRLMKGVDRQSADRRRKHIRQVGYHARCFMRVISWVVTVDVSGLALLLVAFVMHMAVIRCPVRELGVRLLFGGQNCERVMG